MQKPFFSVIIPTLNEEKRISTILSDLSRQTFHDFEVVIVDGNSKDHTVEIAKKWKEKLPHLNIVKRSKPGVSAQRNLGTTKSAADYLFFSDADTRLPAHYLEGVHYALMKKDASFLTTWVVPDINTQSAKMITQLLNFIFEGGVLLGRPYASGAAMMVKRNAFQQLGGFDETLTITEDIDLAHRLYRAGYVMEVLQDPQYIFCMIRYQKDGTLALTAKLVIRSLHPQGNRNRRYSFYPMLGGSYYDTKQQPPSFLRLDEINKVVATLFKSRKKKVQHLIQEFGQLFQSTH